ncbi:hypothetical protein [Lewinella sp. LCG006]|uniref:hypothetical protein n=1 Tax=Lewinella sp. LCG006 TaxID=3231911 RepID=UPI0034603165
MPNQKLLEVVEHLSFSQRKELRLFVGSNYHNRKYNRGKVLQLLEFILDTPAGQEEELNDKEKLNTYFFPEKPFEENDKNPIDSLASDLFSLVREFLLQEEQSSQWTKISESLAMAKFYRLNNLEQRFWQTIKRIRKELKKQQIKDENYFKAQLQTEDEVASFQSTFNTYTDDSNLVKANIALDSYFTISKLEKASGLLFQQHMGQVQTAESLLFSEAIMDQFMAYQDIQTPLAQLYYLVIKLLQNPIGTNDLQDFLAKAEKYEKEIPPAKFRNLMAFYRYFVGRKYQLTVSGQELLNKLFVLYQKHLDKGYFHLGNQACLLPGSLKLMINIAIKVNAIDWASNLLERYPPNQIIGTRYPLEAHSLCTAEVLFAEKKFSEAEQHIVYRNYENVNYSILADILLIKIYYETENDLLESRTSALSQKVRRSKLTKDDKQRYLNFLSLVNQLLKYRLIKPKKALKKLKSQVQELVPIIEREWLQHKLQQLH